MMIKAQTRSRRRWDLVLDDTRSYIARNSSKACCVQVMLGLCTYLLVVHLQYTSRAAQLYKQQLEKESAKLAG